MSLDQESTKCNQKRVNVGFRFLKVRLYFSEKNAPFERLQLLRVPCDGRVPVSTGKDGFHSQPLLQMAWESAFCV